MFEIDIFDRLSNLINSHIRYAISALGCHLIFSLYYTCHMPHCCWSFSAILHYQYFFDFADTISFSEQTWYFARYGQPVRFYFSTYNALQHSSRFPISLRDIAHFYKAGTAQCFFHIKRLSKRYFGIIHKVSESFCIRWFWIKYFSSENTFDAALSFMDIIFLHYQLS